METGIVTQCPAADGSKRQAYQLTEKGRGLTEVLKAVRDWGLEWEPGTRATLLPTA